MCKATANGIYGLKTVVDVYYLDELNSPQLFVPWRGLLTIYLRGEITGVCDDGSGGMALMHPCGTSLPPLYADLTHGVIQIVFPDALWDAKDIPTYMTTGHTTGFDPGSMLVLDKAAGLVGIKLMDVNATWPTYMMTGTFDCGGGMTGDKCFPDMDDDKNPGITVQIQQTGTPPNPGFFNDWKFVPAPTSIPDAASGVGAVEAYIGLRTRLGGSGVISSDCKSGVGTADVDDFESRVYACKMKDGTACTTTQDGQAEFVDKNTPVFHVLKAGDTPPSKWTYTGLNSAIGMAQDHSASKGPSTSVVRLGDPGATVSCADVRNAMYPAAK